MRTICEIVSEWGTFGSREGSAGGRSRQQTELKLRRVKWYGKNPVWDLRGWTGNDEAGKGLTLTTDQLKALKALLDSIDFDNIGNIIHE